MAGYRTQARKLPRNDPGLKMYVVFGTYLHLGPGNAGTYRCCNFFWSHLQHGTAYAAGSLPALPPTSHPQRALKSERNVSWMRQRCDLPQAAFGPKGSIMVF